ncbi:hypothetical protein CL614_08340 [archaeon]|nr:hypothetical protein [archaeon]
MSVFIHGKEYVTVDERVQEFHETHPNGKIETNLITSVDGKFIVKAFVTPNVEVSERVFTGLAYEEVGSSQINQTSALENCETSAVGRALGFLGIGLIGSIATGDEVANAIHQQENKVPYSDDSDIIWFGKHKSERWADMDDGYLNWVSKNMTGKPKRLADDELGKRNPDDTKASDDEVQDEIPF